MKTKSFLTLIVVLFLSFMLFGGECYANEYGPIVVDEEGFGPSSLLLIIPAAALFGLILFGFMQSGKQSYKPIRNIDLEEDALKMSYARKDRLDRELQLVNRKMESYLAKPARKSTSESYS